MEGKDQASTERFRKPPWGYKAFFVCGLLCHSSVMQISPQKKDFFTLLPCSGEVPPWLFMTAGSFGHVSLS